MENKKQQNTEEEFIQLQVRKKEHKKLTEYKVHPNQAYWEVIKKLIEQKESKK